MTWNTIIDPQWQAVWNSAAAPESGLSPSKFEVTGDIKCSTVNGHDLSAMSDRIEKMEQAIDIIKSNMLLEERWEELRILGEQYRALEKDLLDKEKVWGIIKR